MSLFQQRVRQFHQTGFKANQALYEQLKEGQNPEVLFITCADSRIIPSELTQSKPGELFVIRNAGNIIPNYPDDGGESATIEYALTALNIKHIIVCGHSQCGAMKGLLHPETTEGMPVINEWLHHAPKREDITNKFNSSIDTNLLDKAIAENVLLQIEHLKKYPCVKAKLDKDEITLHAWIYAFETGSVLTYNNYSKCFESLLDDTPSQIPVAPPEQTVNNSIISTFILDCLCTLAIGVGGVLVLLGFLVKNSYSLHLGGDLMVYGVSNISFFASRTKTAPTADRPIETNDLQNLTSCGAY